MDIWLRVFSVLETKEIVRIRAVSRGFNEASCSLVYTIDMTGFLSQASLEAIPKSYPYLTHFNLHQEDVDRTGSPLCFSDMYFPKLEILSICCPLESIVLIKGDAPCLKYLEIYNSDVGALEISLPELEHIDLRHVKVVSPQAASLQHYPCKPYCKSAHVTSTLLQDPTCSQQCSKIDTVLCTTDQGCQGGWAFTVCLS